MDTKLWKWQILCLQESLNLMLGCALVQQGHRKALALGGHLQEHLVDQDDPFSTWPLRIPCWSPVLCRRSAGLVKNTPGISSFGEEIIQSWSPVNGNGAQLFSHWIVRFEVLAHLEGDRAVGRRRPRPEQLDLFQVVFVHLGYNIRFRKWILYSNCLTQAIGFTAWAPTRGG